ncbi:LamG-like jellyroll fold domain-containing protein [Actinoplanes subglobosus]|uniref:LamG-like jellyroll fold domain-containing protein n=1 Tax=Actinoplanes subglobosus TaxID=1547892 RepID=A0ABV8ILX8_9ACTN
MIAGLAVPTLAGPVVAACGDVAETEAAAVALAAECGQPVAVDLSRTEYSQVVVQPDGRMTFESSVQPQRVRRGAGWSDINLALSRGADGQLRPAVSLADVVFSGGGTAPLITFTRAGRAMTMSWPGVLPIPSITSNDATADYYATYAEVLTGVDLVVRATETGFTHVLVIKSAAAAAQSAIREIRLDLGGDAEVRSSGGVLEVVGNGAVLASTEPAVMWDSRASVSAATATTRASRAVQAAVSSSTHENAGDGARVAAVGVAVAGDDLVLRPDATLLASAAFPLYVDPAWSVAKAKWAYSTDDGSNNSDTSVARVGRNPDGGALYRSFFQFNTANSWLSLKGKYVHDARVDMKLDHSWSCDKTETSMHWTSAINATPKASWASMDLLRYLASASGRANEAGGCGNIQGDIDMIFKGDAVTGFMREAAANGWNHITVGFTARAKDGSGESTQNRWKKFFPNNAVLRVDYDSRPFAPTFLQAATVNCGPGVVTVGTVAPTLSAWFTDSEGDNDSLTGAFEWIEVPAAGMAAVTNTSPGRLAAPAKKTNITPVTRATTTSVQAEKEKTYAFRAKATDKAPYLQDSEWSAWCQFKVDTDVPSVEGTVLTWPSGPGQKARIRISSDDADVTKFQYGWDEATTVVSASTDSNGMKYADVDVTAQTFGTNRLKLKAIDTAINEGVSYAVFSVGGSPAVPVARWGLEEYPGVTRQEALTDRVPAPTDSSLTATSLVWERNLRLQDGWTATFNGTSSAATAVGPVVNTATSFSVAGWVHLKELLPTTHITFASQDGTDAAGFELGVRQAGTTPAPYWSFGMKDTSAQSSATVAALSSSALTVADIGRWTHLAGTYDAVEKKLRLYVNGKKVAETNRTATPWSAAGRFAVGRGFTGGTASGFWNGSIADVQAFDRVLVPEDFTGKLASAPDSGGFDEPGILTPVQASGWNFESAVACETADLRDTCEAPDNTGWDRRLALTRGADVRNGSNQSLSGSALWLDEQYFPAGDGTTPQVTSEYGRSAAKTGYTAPDSSGRQFNIWQDKQVLRTDQSFTVAVWVKLDPGQTGSHHIVSQRGVNESAFGLRYHAASGKWVFGLGSQDVPNAAATTMYNLKSTSDAVVGPWTHLAAVYDAAAQQARIYVNGQQEATLAVPAAPFNATGPLLVGRTLYHGVLTDKWHGGLDDLNVFQGAMSNAAVAVMYDRQRGDATSANELGVNESMRAGDALRSLNGVFQLRMQSDGNLVLYRDGAPVWATNTAGNEGAFLVMQGDDNLVLYRVDKTALWHTNTGGSGADRLVLSDDGRLELQDSTFHVYWRR